MFNQNFTKKILFVGIPDMAYVCLDGLLMSGVNIVGVLGPKKNHPTFYDFKSFIKHKKLNYIDYEKLDDVSLINNVRDLNADIAVVCSFNYKIPKILLNSVKGGFINIHPSLLPKYRGPNPYSAIILNGEKEAGVTIHYMDEEFDTGDIIHQKKINISDYETMGTLFNRTNILAVEMLLEVLKKYEDTELPRIKQPSGIFPKGEIIPEQNLYINYKQTAVEINNLIRALNPFILARTMFRGTLTKILSADIIKDNKNKNIIPGRIFKIKDDKIFIETLDGLLVPSSMQFGSFFAGTSKEFIKILNPKEGEIFE